MLPRTVLLDLDGTLIDHFDAIHRSYNHTLPQLGHPRPTRQQVRDAVGGGLEEAMLRFITREQLPEALRIYREYFDRTMLDDVILLPGAHELLEALDHRGVACAVFTNKLGDASRRICQHLGLSPFLRGVFGAKDTPWLKPDPAFSRHALERLAGTPDSALLIGDSPFDVDAGRSGGFPCWAVCTGTHTAEQLAAAGADRVFTDLVALGATLLREP
jgi:phosphoglycolate phosphatase-like HAD superfamily hydrolase